VLEDVDLEIRAGEVVALVGRTGSGKTTMADLLLRFHEPTQGAILLDGVDLRRIKRRSLHELIAIVTQEPFLFEGSILDNIRYGRRDLTLKEVVDAARAANAHEFIEALPEGYETNVGEFGSQLSGGQRQRVTIARAILRDPQILIFDEATSSLDAKAERAVQEAIHNLMKGRTVLLIAHRLSTVKSADRIAILQDGRIAMVGTHDELMARGGLYRELVELNTSA
jgi:ABC-type multidrug transport system fused ATPase/permease subunit